MQFKFDPIKLDLPLDVNNQPSIFEINLLVNGHHHCRELLVVRSSTTYNKRLALTRTNDDQVVLSVAYALAYSLGTVETLDIIIRNHEGIAVKALLNVPLIVNTPQQSPCKEETQTWPKY